MPWWPFEKTAEMFPRIVTPNSLPTARLLARPAAGGWSARAAYVTRLDGTKLESLRDAVAWANVAAWALLLVGGVAGLCLGRQSGFALFACFAAAHLLPPILAFGQARFRLPVVPLLAIGLGFLAARGAEAWRAAGPGRRAGVVLAAAVVAGASASFWWTLSAPQWG
jgi:hypothetical protein